MNVFNHYARYYDLLYRDKDYAGEAAFVHQQLARAGRAGSTMLELGCGTGRHALEFARHGWSVTGYDLSEGMVEQAQRRAGEMVPALAEKLKFAVGDARRVRSG
jgi:ubiquinone/menaquinone biosynthesis C-methylase UbiE